MGIKNVNRKGNRQKTEVVVSGFNGLITTALSSNNVQPNFFQNVSNIDFTTDGQVKKRNGTVAMHFISNLDRIRGLCVGTHMEGFYIQKVELLSTLLFYPTTYWDNVDNNYFNEQLKEEATKPFRESGVGAVEVSMFYFEASSGGEVQKKICFIGREYDKSFRERLDSRFHIQGGVNELGVFDKFEGFVQIPTNTANMPFDSRTLTFISGEFNNVIREDISFDNILNFSGLPVMATGTNPENFIDNEDPAVKENETRIPIAVGIIKKKGAANYTMELVVPYGRKVKSTEISSSILGINLAHKHPTSKIVSIVGTTDLTADGLFPFYRRWVEQDGANNALYLYYSSNIPPQNIVHAWKWIDADGTLIVDELPDWSDTNNPKPGVWRDSRYDAVTGEHLIDNSYSGFTKGDGSANKASVTVYIMDKTKKKDADTDVPYYRILPDVNIEVKTIEESNNSIDNINRLYSCKKIAIAPTGCLMLFDGNEFSNTIFQSYLGDLSYYPSGQVIALADSSVSIKSINSFSNSLIFGTTNSLLQFNGSTLTPQENPPSIVTIVDNQGVINQKSAITLPSQMVFNSESGIKSLVPKNNLDNSLKVTSTISEPVRNLIKKDPKTISVSDGRNVYFFFPSHKSDLQYETGGYVNMFVYEDQWSVMYYDYEMKRWSKYDSKIFRNVKDSISLFGELFFFTDEGAFQFKEGCYVDYGVQNEDGLYLGHQYDMLVKTANVSFDGGYNNKQFKDFTFKLSNYAKKHVPLFVDIWADGSHVINTNKWENHLIDNQPIAIYRESVQDSNIDAASGSFDDGGVYNDDVFGDGTMQTNRIKKTIKAKEINIQVRYRDNYLLTLDSYSAYFKQIKGKARKVAKEPVSV